MFDRSGPYSSGPFDIHEKPEQFIRAIAGYTMMSDEELGLDTFVERDGGDLSITVTEDATGDEKRLQLVPDPLIVQRAIVCRGTNCYRTKDSNSVAKFAWASDRQPSEVDLLRITHQKGVRGVARLLGYHRITSIEEMRDRLTFPAPYHFRNIFLQSQSQQQLSQTFGPFQRLSFPETFPRPSKKQKSINHEAKFSKRSKSHSQSKLRQQNKATSFKKPTSVNQWSKSHQEQVSQTLKNIQTKKRKSKDNEEKTSKRSRSNNQISSLCQENEASQTLENTQNLEFLQPGHRPFKQRIFGCLAIFPAGQTISKFGSIPQLLTALCDAIKAHRSLYIDGNILHRDISENNIIITDPKKTDGFTGMLIDLDLAIEIGAGRTGAQYLTGTMEFMAIQVLQQVAHTYRHDLESFFYVLLWICARCVWEREFGCELADRPKKSILTKWYTGDYDDIAQSKAGAMHAYGFEYILAEFPASLNCVKPLCRRMRRILFPLTDDEKLDLGTPADPKKLYDPIIQAFEDAIADITSIEKGLA